MRHIFGLIFVSMLLLNRVGVQPFVSDLSKNEKLTDKELIRRLREKLEKEDTKLLTEVLERLGF